MIQFLQWHQDQGFALRMVPFFDAVKDLQQQYPVGTSDPSKTEQIMQSKGCAKDSDRFWSKGGERFSMVILIPPGFFENFAPIIVAQLRKAGFDASFRAPTNEATIIGTGDADAYINGHLASVRDPHLSMNLYHSQYAAATGEVAQQPKLSIGRGERFGLVGESGSEKSTTAWAIMRLIKPPGRIESGVMVILPSLVFFLVASGRIARGLAAGAVKG